MIFRYTPTNTLHNIYITITIINTIIIAISTNLEPLAGAASPPPPLSLRATWRASASALPRLVDVRPPILLGSVSICSQVNCHYHQYHPPSSSFTAITSDEHNIKSLCRCLSLCLCMCLLSLYVSFVFVIIFVIVSPQLGHHRQAPHRSTGQLAKPSQGLLSHFQQSCLEFGLKETSTHFLSKFYDLFWDCP